MRLQSKHRALVQVARILWTTHLTFQEGFDDNMMAMLQQQYPSRLMPELKERSQVLSLTSSLASVCTGLLVSCLTLYVLLAASHHLLSLMRSSEHQLAMTYLMLYRTWVHGAG